MIYQRINYLILGASIFLIILGFVLMSGGGSDDPNTFNPEIFAPRRVVWAPIICTLGFAGIIVGLMYKGKKG